MKYFTIPADFKKETVDKYAELNDTYKDSKILETYGNLTLGENLGSGRVVKDLPLIGLLDLQEYVEYLKKKNIEFNYTLNAPFLQNKEFTSEGMRQIKDFLKDLYNIGVDSLTIAMPSLMEIVKMTHYKFTLKASTICHITNVNRAKAYKRMGADRIVVDESIHRKFGTLKRIVEAVGDKVEIIVNTMCHRNCAYRMFHYNQTGGDSVSKSNQVAVDFFEHKCMLQRYHCMSELLKLGWVRPEDLKHYTHVGIYYFKLQGRQHVILGDHIRALEHYFKESYDGDLMELLDMFNSRYSFKVHLDNKSLEGYLKPFLENDGFCKQDCETCKYCENFAPQCIDRNKADDMMESGKKFYKEYDPFADLYNSTESQEQTGTSISQVEEAVGFNLD
jgi:collagenase-like PrtC family protease